VASTRSGRSAHADDHHEQLIRADQRDRQSSPHPSGPARDRERRSFALRKSLVLLRRVVIPMREVTNTLMRHDLHAIHDDLMSYYQDVYDHVLRAAEWTESLRDLVNSILETNLTIQGNRMNVITKKVTSWAAIIAVPTFVAGFYGMTCLIPASAGPAVAPPPSA
jgi:magnesium transporter